MAAAPTFPLTLRFRVALYALAFTAIAALADTEGRLTPLLLALIAGAVAWLLVDAPSLPPRAAGPSAPPAPVPPSQGFPAALARWWAAHDPRGNGLPAFVLNLVVLLAAANLWREVRSQIELGNKSLIICLSDFIVTLLLCKLFERKTLRNIAQILILSLLIVVAATIFSTSSLFFFLIFAVYFLLLFYVFLLVNLSAETDRLAVRAFIPAVFPGAAPSAGRNGAGRNPALASLRHDLRAVARQCAFLALPVAIIMFLLIPRTRANAMIGPWGVGASQTGFSDVVQFREYGQITESDAEVMKVRIFRADKEVGEEFGDLYFRGAVLEDYDAKLRRWTRGTSDSPAPATEPLPYDFNNVRVEYEILAPFSTHLFVLAPSVLLGDHLQYTYATAQYIYSPADMTLRLGENVAPGRDNLHYAALWDRDYIPSSNATPYIDPPGVLRRERRIVDPDPANPDHVIPAVIVSPEISALARQVLARDFGGDFPTPGQKIPLDQIRSVMVVLENYLRANYPYSLAFRQVNPKLDPTTDFLLNRGVSGNKTGGHCEYFASAMVMLCRAVGLNARMVTGYRGGEYKPGIIGDGYFSVRQKDAHAWAEIFIPGEGWVLSDPTPAAASPDAADAGARWFTDLAHLIQSIWLTTVVSFDNDSRAAIGQWFSDRFDSLLNIQPYAAWITPILWTFLFLSVAILLVLRRRFRRLQPLLAGTQGLPHRQLRLASHVSFLDALLHLFDRSGLRPPDQTPLEFLRPHFPKLGPAAADARWLVETAYGIRFGNLALDADLKREVALALKNVKTALLTPH